MNNQNKKQKSSDVFERSLFAEFYPSQTLTQAQFCEYAGVERALVWQMKKNGKYPKTIKFDGRERIHLLDLVAWLRGDPDSTTPAAEFKKRGRPVGSRNKPRPSSSAA